MDTFSTPVLVTAPLLGLALLIVTALGSLLA